MQVSLIPGFLAFPLGKTPSFKDDSLPLLKWRWSNYRAKQLVWAYSWLNLLLIETNFPVMLLIEFSQGLLACEDSEANIGNGSCIGDYACDDIYYEVDIGSYSCIGYYACYDNDGEYTWTIVQMIHSCFTYTLTYFLINPMKQILEGTAGMTHYYFGLFCVFFLIVYLRPNWLTLPLSAA